MSQHPLETSTDLVADRYQVERVIARGGMGVVYLARQIGVGREVALKVLSPPPDSDDSGSFEERFILEAQTLGALHHANIVTLYDFGRSADGRFYLALEYIDGPRYTDLLRDGDLTPTRAVRLLIQVCDALGYAHRRGVVHRDLKPSNLLIRRGDDGEDQVKVVDFGLVKVMEKDQSLTGVGLILGSPHCMAPEQIQGQDIDHRADIYAMGILLFRSFTGRWPFHGETSTATMVSHLRDATPRFADVAPEVVVPGGLEQIVRKCLEKEPEDRYPDVGSLKRDLQRVLGVEGSIGNTTTSGVSAGPSFASSVDIERTTPPGPAPARGMSGRSLVLLGLLLLVSATAVLWVSTHKGEAQGTEIAGVVPVVPEPGPKEGPVGDPGGASRAAEPPTELVPVEPSSGPEQGASASSAPGPEATPDAVQTPPPPHAGDKGQKAVKNGGRSGAGSQSAGTKTEPGKGDGSPTEPKKEEVPEGYLPSPF